jgi:hypothetical protein
MINPTHSSREGLIKEIVCTGHGYLTKIYIGGYSRVVHLFPFRTEKLSTLAPMVLPLGGRVGRCQFYESLVADA